MGCKQDRYTSDARCLCVVGSVHVHVWAQGASVWVRVFVYEELT